MAIEQVIRHSVENVQPVHLLAILVSVGALYYFFLRKPSLNIPIVTPDPGPEGVFNTITRSYEEVC